MASSQRDSNDQHDSNDPRGSSDQRRDSNSQDEQQRAEYLKQQRAKMIASMAEKKATMKKKTATTEGVEERRTKAAASSEGVDSARRGFISRKETVENRLKQSTIGLVRLEEFQRIKGELEEERQREAAKTLLSAGDEKKPKKKPKKPKRSVLSFDDGEDDEDDSSSGAVLAKKARKNPAVDTSFLPDKEREEEEARLREELRQQWLRDQEGIKQEAIMVTYSYWDGSGHRRQVRCRKGNTIAQFLDKCRAQIPELRSVSVDSLVYVKEDLIIPHHYSFYDFIVNKARGKSGPLFNFDVHDDVRLTGDVRVEKDESHAGKVCERAWYERNKHIFPANRWEIFDPEKSYGTYTIRDSTRSR
ncbi:hypothetical protein GGF46_001854 [Coemansia sp. RSA 552]|nr:hypothetical protein GGF46_001854 [Coemansia sp. RSA 552]